VTPQEFEREWAKSPTARKRRLIAIKSFFSFLREVEAVLAPTQDATWLAPIWWLSRILRGSLLRSAVSSR
jgi:hypothetical protein